MPNAGVFALRWRKQRVSSCLSDCMCSLAHVSYAAGTQPCQKGTEGQRPITIIAMLANSSRSVIACQMQPSGCSLIRPSWPISQSVAAAPAKALDNPKLNKTLVSMEPPP